MGPDPGDLEKLKRRHKRNLRAATAKGYLLGVRSMLKPGDLVIDCGANLGDVAEPLAETGATVECFEPDPHALLHLRARLGSRDNVRIHAAAVGTTEGTVALHRAEGFDDRPDGRSVKSTVLKGGRGVDDAATVDVPQIDFLAHLRARIGEHGEIAFLKLDIEGAELDLLEAMHAEGLFAHIRCTVAETHERKFRDLRPRFRALRETFAEAYPVERVNLDWI